MKYRFEYYKEENGYWAKCLELDGCYAQGDSLEELKSNCEEALNLFLVEPDDSENIIFLPSIV